jgi:hypothetical protein
MGLWQEGLATQGIWFKWDLNMCCGCTIDFELRTEKDQLTSYFSYFFNKKNR